MKFKSTLVIAVSLWLMPTPSMAADKVHQQLLAEIRMLQEQQAQLQQMLGGLADTLKTMNAKIDDQTGATRKGFADQMLVINGISDGVRVLREKSDDTNVRLATMTQEIESMRQAIQSAPAAAPAAAVTIDPVTGAPTGAPPAVPTQPSSSGVSPGKAFDAAFYDYTSGQHDLAIQGFEFYIREFPTSPRADDAQLGIGNSYYALGNYKEAVAAYQKVTAIYGQTDSAPQAWYKLGLSYEGLKQPELARRAYETVIKLHNAAPDAQLARQRLDSLIKK
ncbi:MAG: tetratricopeptide repeat protein [Acidobacteriota bacterium]|nr:tetratricopeptide repeat protein [Acidobacteriota bacterium]MDQ3418755.1 tetratricopeptide repeat protein [Acidobacteriota bacterium]